MKKCKLFLVYALILFSIMIGSVQAMTVKADYSSKNRTERSVSGQRHRR